MTEFNLNSSTNLFFRQGGEMARLIDSFNWSQTSLGPIHRWPQSLITAVNVILYSPVPMVILWDAEGIMIYNDPYSVFAGARHPILLGSKVVEGWPEVADFNRNVLEKVLEGGGILSYQDQQLTLFRNNEAEEVWMDLNYSPVINENGVPGGVLAIVVETTQRVLAETKRDEAEANLLRANEAVHNERKRLLSMFMQAPNPICILRGSDYVIDLVNKEMLKVWNKTHEEVIDKPILEALPELRGQGIQELLDKVFYSGETYVGKELLVQHDNGKGGLEEVYFTFVYEPMRNNEGQVEGIMADAFVVTEQVLARKRTEENESRFRTMVDNFHNLAWMAEPDGYIFWYNKRWYEYTGTNLEEMQGWGWEKVHHPDHIHRVVSFVVDAWKLGESFEMEFPLRRFDGVYKWFLTRVYPIKDEDGNIIRWIGTNTDIDEQKNALNQKDEFIGIASHELKTPLTSVKGSLQIIEQLFKDNNYSQMEKFIHKADHHVNKLTGLINDLLDVSKFHSGKLEFNISEFSVKDLIRDSLEQVIYQNKHHKIIVKCEEALTISGDKVRLEQVLVNLLTNAIKYSPKADEIILGCEVSGTFVRFSVRDKGIGIPEDKLEYLFERFYRIQETAPHFQGMGLGLYISKQIIERHAGRIWAESKKGEGSAFHFEIPVKSEVKK